jgi:hypothetical protein
MKYKSLGCAIAMSVGVLTAPLALADLNDGLVAHYPFDGNAQDASGNGNDGTVNGATLTEDRLGNVDSAYQLDGNDYIEVQDSSLLDLTATFTISLWINQSQAQASGYRLIDKVTPGVNDGYGFDTYDNSTGKRMRFIGGAKNVSANTAYSLNEWHYLVVTFSNGTSTFYLDGITDGSGNHGSSMQTNNLPLRIGTSRSKYTNTLGFKGMMDDVRIYNRALSECEIQSLYTGKDECAPVCQLYGVHDDGLNDSQLFTVNPDTLEVNALGELHEKHDIEALDIHPQTGELYAASGDNTPKKGYLYQVNKTTGEVTAIGATGCREVDALSFHPNGTLWGWAQDCGLLTLDTSTGQSNVVISASQVEVEDITWNTAGTILYGVENLHGKHHPDSHGADEDDYNEDLDFDQGVRLWAYASGAIGTVCDDLTQEIEIEIEALETLPDDSLLFGFHGIDSILNVGAVNVQNCQLIAQEKLPAVPYNDVEGIAWPTKACAQ